MVLLLTMQLLVIALQGICTIKPAMSNFKCQWLPSKKQLETCFYWIHLLFHVLSTGDDKSSLNTIFLDIYLHLHVIFWISIAFRLDLSSPVDRAWKNMWIKKIQVSSCFFLKEVIGILSLTLLALLYRFCVSYLHFLPCHGMPTTHTCLPHIPDSRQPSGLLGCANLISMRLTVLKLVCIDLFIAGSWCWAPDTRSGCMKRWKYSLPCFMLRKTLANWVSINM